MKNIIYVILITCSIFILAMFNSKTFFDKTLSVWKLYTTAQFEVYGNENLLKDMKITMKIIKQNKADIHGHGNCSDKIETLFYNGKNFHVDIEFAMYYKIYFSYKNTHVGVLKFENISQWLNGYINHIEVKQYDNLIGVKYYGLKSMKDDELSVEYLVPIKEFFEKHNIDEVGLEEKLKHRFLDYYEPLKSNYKVVNCDLKSLL